MSTYLPGVTDNGFNPVQYTPNFPYLANALQKATARYETNYEQISQGFKSILNTPILNDKYSKRRDDYLNQIKDQLKTISTTDLSIQSNVDSAENLYSPFWEDKTMLAHIADTKSRYAQLAEQEKIKKEHPDYDNNTPITVMNYYMNKIKTADDPDIINQVPLIKATPLQNHPKEFQDWIKKNEWKQELSWSQNGRIYKQVNGDGLYKSFADLFKTYLGESANDQYSMYGEYFKIQGIQDIKDDERKFKGVEISDEEAISMLPKYHIDQQIKSYDDKIKYLKDSRIIAQTNADNARNSNEDLYSQYITQGGEINKRIKELEKEASLLKTKGVGNEEDKIKYDEIIKRISTSPTAFFANLKMDKDMEVAAKSAASKQSLEITTDQSYWNNISEQRQATEFAQTHSLNVRKQNWEETKKSIESGGENVEYDASGKPIALKNIIPTVTATTNANKIESDVETFNSAITSMHSTGLQEMKSVLESVPINMLQDVISPQEVGFIFSAIANDPSTMSKDYQTTLKDVESKLNTKLEGAGLKPVKLTGPIVALSAVSDYYSQTVEKDINNLNDMLAKNEYDASLQNRINSNYQTYTKLQSARNKLNNAYALRKQYDERIAAQVEKNPEKYKDITIKDKNGKSLLFTAENLSNIREFTVNNKRVKLPLEIAQAYVNGTLKPEPIYEEEITYTSPTTNISVKSKVIIGYTATDKNGQTYDITGIVRDYGKPEEVRKKLDKGYGLLKSAIPENLQKTISEETGKMGKTITYMSSPTDRTDYADRIAQQVFTNINNIVDIEDDKYVIVGYDEDQQDKLQKLITKIVSDPAAGLTSLKYHNMGSPDPTKRNITFTYNKDELLKNIDKKDRSKYDFFNGEITFQLRNEAMVPGMPNPYQDHFYSLLLSNGTVKSSKTDEDFGLKYEIYKDITTGNIKFKAGYKIVQQDPTNNVLTYNWKDYTGNTNYDETSFVDMPNTVTVEDFIDALRKGVNTQSYENSTILKRTYTPVQDLNYAQKQLRDKLDKEYNSVFNTTK
jgi:hypothetical protein